MNLSRLQALVMLARHGSIARAAEVLHVTPSGVSQQLAKLERETGHRLLESVGRGVRLTRAGQVLVGHAVRVLDQLAAADADLASLDEQVVGPLRLGSVGSAIRSLLPGVLAGLAIEHPRLIVELRDGEVSDMLPGLSAGDLDVLLLESWVNHPPPLPAGLAVRTLVHEQAQVALAADHPLAQRDDVDLRELVGLPWACCPPSAEANKALVQTMRSIGVEPDIRFAVSEYPSQLALVAAGLAAAMVPAAAQQPVPPNIRFLSTNPVLHRDVRAAWRTDGEGPALRALLTALEPSSSPGEFDRQRPVAVRDDGPEPHRVLE